MFKVHEMYLWNPIIILVLRRQIRRARNGRSEQRWIGFTSIRDDLLDNGACTS